VRTIASTPGASALGAGSAARLARILATAGVLLVLVVIVSSAYLRLSQAGLSCSDWPACYGRATQLAAVTQAQQAVRLTHRVAASVVGLLLLGILGVASAQRPRLRSTTLQAVVALAVAVGLAAVGAVTGESTRLLQLPAVSLTNLLGGFVLLGVLCSMRETLRVHAIADARPSPQPRSLRLLCALALLCVTVQVALGALVSARFAALACPSFPACGAALAIADLPHMLDPLAAVDVDAANNVTRSPALATLQFAHRVFAHVVLVVTVAVVAVAWRVGGDVRRRAVTLGVLVVIVLALGAATVLTQARLPVVLAHNLAAAALFAALVVQTVRMRNERPPMG